MRLETNCTLTAWHTMHAFRFTIATCNLICILMHYILYILLYNTNMCIYIYTEKMNVIKNIIIYICTKKYCYNL